MVSWNQCQLTYLPWKLLSKQPHFIEYRDLLFLTAGSLFATDILIAKKSQVFLQKNLKILKNYSKFLEHFSSFKDWLKMCLPIIRVEISVNWLLIFMFYSWLNYLCGSKIVRRNATLFFLTSLLKLSDISQSYLWQKIFAFTTKF